MDFNVSLLWLIPALPLLAFVVIVFLTRPWKRFSAFLSLAAIFIALLLAIWAFQYAPVREQPLQTSIPWLKVGDAEFEFGILFDRITALMLIVVTLVSFLVQLFSIKYMSYDPEGDPYIQPALHSGGHDAHGHDAPGHGDEHSAPAEPAGHDAHGGHGGLLDPGYSRYYAFLSLFTLSMLGLVLANNLAMLYMTWELVGLCSYLLIGYWFHKPEAASAAKKAFIVTRFGDFGFLIGILIVYFITHELRFTELFESQALLHAGVGWLGLSWLTIAAVLLFCGAVGKSAQFPLHVWLPDAMQGPTPVSALIHAATMVAAGVYMVARLFPLFEHSQQAMLTVAVIGGFTALLAATMGVVMNDIKQVMAYSTISQLGYMMMGLGVGGLVAGVFHLFNHAFFKALLFLGSGSVIYSTGHVQDMRRMGGLRHKMPVTYLTLAAASLSLAGIIPFSGFWSKDEILADVFTSGHTILFVMGLFGSFLTAFYTTRMMLLTFHGEYRGPKDEHEAHSGEFGHQKPFKDVTESPAVMTIPLIILGILSVVSGLWNMNGGFTAFLAPEEHFAMNWNIALLSLAVAGAGIFFGILVYGVKAISAEGLGSALEPLYTLVSHKYYLDELYGGVMAQYPGVLFQYVVLGFSNLVHWIDQRIIDGIVNGTGRFVVWLGGEMSQLETGRLQNYALGAFGGAVVIVFLMVFLGVR